jgi:hypothetical protein
MAGTLPAGSRRTPGRHGREDSPPGRPRATTAVGDHGGVEIACARCGTAFGCGIDGPASEPCWCAAIPLAAPTRDRLAVAYAGCLCPACLASAAVTTDAPPDSATRPA